MRIERPPQAADITTLLEVPVGVAEVEKGDWLRGSGDMTTFPVDNCIVLAAHNKASGDGILGQFNCIAPSSHAMPELVRDVFDTDAFNEAVTALPDLGPPDHTSLWLGGGAIVSEGSPPRRQGIRNDRQYAQAQVASTAGRIGIDPSAIKTEWNRTAHDLAVTLRSASGLLVVQLIHWAD